jgi:hypothetical protein
MILCLIQIFVNNRCSSSKHGSSESLQVNVRKKKKDMEGRDEKSSLFSCRLAKGQTQSLQAPFEACFLRILTDMQNARNQTRKQLPRLEISSKRFRKSNEFSLQNNNIDQPFWCLTSLSDPPSSCLELGPQSHPKE